MFCGPGTPSTQFRWFHIHSTLHHLIRLASAPFTTSHLANCCVPFVVCNAWKWSKTQNLRRVCKNSGPILSRLWTEVDEIFRRCRSPFLFSNAFDQLARNPFERYSPLTLKVVEKPNRCTEFLAPSFFGGGTIPTFVLQIVSAIYCPP